MKQTPDKTQGERDPAPTRSGRATALRADKTEALPLPFSEGGRITVTVACATSERQQVEEVQLDPGATIEQTIVLSGIAKGFPDLDLSRCSVGIHGRVKAFDHPVQEGDRVEIYRPVEATS